MKRVLVAIDFWDSIDKVVNHAKRMIKESGGQLLFVHCETLESYLFSITTESYQQPSMELIEIQKQQIEDKLKGIQNKLNKDGIESKWILMDGPIVDNILKEADIFNADLIVIGSHKHGKFHDLLFGSTHKSLISLSRIPVLIVPSENNKN
ncbi:MAG: universal stress protein [Candidatus Cloacimonadota bacterium]|nr:universal stress protein [Candidatus Cloacimonadota bacterium]